MPVRRRRTRTTRRRTRKSMRGGSVPMPTLSLWERIKHFAGKTRLASRTARQLIGDKYGIANWLHQKGYGKRRRTRRTRTRRTRPMRGGFGGMQLGWRNILSSLHETAKRGRWGSRALNALGMNRWGNAVSQLGYGKRRRTRRVRRMRGGVVRRRGTSSRALLTQRRVSLMGGRRRRTRRTTRRTQRGRGFWSTMKSIGKTIGGGALSTAGGMLLKSLVGGRRRRRTTRRVRRTQRGRGFIGRIAGGLLGGLLPF